MKIISNPLTKVHEYILHSTYFTWTFRNNKNKIFIILKAFNFLKHQFTRKINIIFSFFFFFVLPFKWEGKESSEGDKTYSFDYLCAFILYTYHRKKDIKLIFYFMALFFLGGGDRRRRFYTYQGS